METEIKYEGYIKRQQEKIQAMKKKELIEIPENFDYDNCTGIRLEAREKLSAIRPLNIGQAGRITGVTPADASVLAIYLKRNEINM